MKEVITLAVSGIAIFVGIDWIRHPENSLKFNLDYHLFFRDSDPTKFYLVMARIVGVLMIVLALLLGGVVLFNGLKGLW